MAGVDVRSIGDEGDSSHGQRLLARRRRGARACSKSGHFRKKIQIVACLEFSIHLLG
jgi:hypothetical protein